MSSLKLALVQSPLHWNEPARNRELFEQHLSALEPGTELILLPEMFTTGFTMTPENLPQQEAAQSLSWMQHMATQTGAALAGSMVFSEEGQYYNRLFFVFPDGTYKSYDKRHTFTLAGEDKAYVRGKQRLTLTYKGFKICPMICYDLRFPVWSRNTEDYDLLLYLANWPEPRIEAWDTLLKARAIENMAYCVGVNRIGRDDNGLNYPGHSAVYDALGGQLTFSTHQGITYATLDRESMLQTRKKLRFLDDRDHFTIQ